MQYSLGVPPLHAMHCGASRTASSKTTVEGPYQGAAAYRKQHAFADSQQLKRFGCHELKLASAYALHCALPSPQCYSMR